MIRSDQEKALNLLDELARTNGLELVMRRYDDGSGYTLFIQKEGSMHTFDSIICGTNDSGRKVYDTVKAAIAQVVAKRLP